MAIYGAAFELCLSREAAGAALHPNQPRYYRSDSAWAAGTPLLTTLQLGDIPYPASGLAPVVRSIAGVSKSTVGGPFSLAGNALDDFAAFDGASTATTAALIQRCGYNNLYVGRGRAAGGDFVAAAGALRTALLNGGSATTLSVDCLAGAGYYDSPLVGANPWETSDLNGGIWTSHIGIYDFVDDLVNANTRQNEIFNDIAIRGNSYTLPDGFVLQNCSYAAISPEGLIWVDNGDVGVSIPASVGSNTANAFRNHPGVFVRPAGSGYLRAVGRRWRDRYAINTTGIGSQPIGIFTTTETVSRSKWLMVVDGVAFVCYVSHPAATDYRRPRDIWNNVIAPLIATTGSDVSRITVTDAFGVAIGTETRWQYLSYARYLGAPGDTTQTDTTPPG